MIEETEVLEGELSTGGLIIGAQIGQRGPQGETGNGIASIIKTSTSGLVDTYTITFDNGDTTTFNVTNGAKGDPGAIKIIIVAELPSTGDDDTIYLVPLENPTEEGNNYAEYIYINGQWELLGKIGVHVDLTDYVKNTDYANSTTAGVFKTNTNYATEVTSTGSFRASTKTYSFYTTANDGMLIGKGTLENVLNVRIGDIDSALDLINGEVI